jgi:hypothetical protein
MNRPNRNPETATEPQQMFLVKPPAPYPQVLDGTRKHCVSHGGAA